jgi:hypothetical protein
MSRPCVDSWVILSSARANRQRRSMPTAYGHQGSTHTFWNAGDGELRVLELIVPGDLRRRSAQASVEIFEHVSENCQR